MASVDAVIMAKKMGRVRAHRNELTMGGSARSARRSISGPDPGFGAAIIVRLGMICLSRAFRTPGGRIRSIGTIVSRSTIVTIYVDDAADRVSRRSELWPQAQ